MPQQGPTSYFSSIESQYGGSVAEWQQIIGSSGLDRHMAIVGCLKAEHSDCRDFEDNRIPECGIACGSELTEKLSYSSTFVVHQRRTAVT